MYRYLYLQGHVIRYYTIRVFSYPAPVLTLVPAFPVVVDMIETFDIAIVIITVTGSLLTSLSLSFFDVI